MAEPPVGRMASIQREFNSVVAAGCLLVAAYIALRGMVPGTEPSELLPLVRNFIGPVWPALAAIGGIAVYALGAWLCDVLDLAPRRDWTTLGRLLQWATEASPMLGLLQTFASLIQALLAYSEAGPGSIESQTAFIGEFSRALGSTIAGGVIALVSFTLHRLVSRD